MAWAEVGNLQGVEAWDWDRDLVGIFLELQAQIKFSVVKVSTYHQDAVFCFAP